MAEDTNYTVTFAVKENAYNTLASTTEGTLEEICDLCKEFEAKATLRDESGWIKGFVDRDGNYRLQ